MIKKKDDNSESSEKSEKGLRRKSEDEAIEVEQGREEDTGVTEEATAENQAETQGEEQASQPAETGAKPQRQRGPQQRHGKGPGPARGGKPEEQEGVEQVIAINRITKVTKGGKKLSFSALVVVGDTKGQVGYSLEKAAEVSIAIRKAIASAKKNMVAVSLNGTTIPHEIIGQCGGARVLLKPAADGTGVIAAGPVRAVCDGAGIHNILTKCHRSNNPINVVKATFDGLTRLKPANKATAEVTENATA